MREANYNRITRGSDRERRSGEESVTPSQAIELVKEKYSPERSISVTFRYIGQIETLGSDSQSDAENFQGFRDEENCRQDAISTVAFARPGKAFAYNVFRSTEQAQRFHSRFRHFQDGCNRCSGPVDGRRLANASSLHLATYTSLTDLNGQRKKIFRSA